MPGGNDANYYWKENRRHSIGIHARNLTICLAFTEESNAVEFMNALITYCPLYQGSLWLYDLRPEPKLPCVALAEEMRRIEYPVRLMDTPKRLGELRNHCARSVSSNWIMFFDEKVRLAGNPFETMRDDLNTMKYAGCSLPLLDENDHVWTFGQRLDVCDDSEELWLIQQTVHQPDHRNNYFARLANFDASTFRGLPEAFMTNGIQHQACAFFRKDFLRVGGYDEMLEGDLLDWELALRYWEHNMTLGVSTCLLVTCPPVKPVIMRESAARIEQKYGFHIAGTNNPPPVFAQARDLPRIALIIDRPKWAFDHIAQQIVKHVRGFEFEIIAAADYENMGQILGLSPYFDLMHFFWRGFHYMYNGTYQSELIAFGMTLADVEEKARLVNATLGLYDHLWLEGAQWDINKHVLSHLIKGYTVSSPKLMEAYQGRDIPPPDAMVTDGVELASFPARHLERLREIGERPLRVGWAGNSEFMAHEQDYKGLHSIIKPALALLEKQGIPTELVLADRKIKLIPHHRMERFYNTLDVYVCASVAEGTPNPALESMACGVPVVSTDVGLIGSLFGSLQQPFILRQRSPEALAEALALIYQSKGLAERLSQENQAQIQNWQWDIVLRPLECFFQKMIEKKER